MGGFFAVIFTLAAIAFGIFVYFIPSVVASKKSHESFTGILLLNIFLGWSLVGWVIALVWAVSEKKAVAVYAQQHQNTPRARTKKCLFCAEEILAEARKCKHCGSDVSPIEESSPTIECHYCRGQILSTATQCRHCLRSVA